MEKQYFVLDDVLSIEECLYLYHELQNAPVWSLARTSKQIDKHKKQFSSFPGFIVEDNGVVENEFFSGYFRAISFRIRQLILKKHNVRLPVNVQRIHLGAKNSESHTDFHIDSDNGSAWTILGFLNPVWNRKDGGQFYLDDIEIEYKTARFIIFKSNTNHNGGFIVNDQLKNWRISLNVILQ